MSASSQKAALDKAGTVYVNGHHGKAKLEHAISASYSNLTQMLQAISDEPTASPLTKLESQHALAATAVPTAVPAKPVPATVPKPAEAVPAKAVPAAVPARPVPAKPVPATVPVPAQPVSAAVPARPVPELAKPVPAAVPTEPVPAKPVPAAVLSTPSATAGKLQPCQPAAASIKSVPDVGTSPSSQSHPSQPRPSTVSSLPRPDDTFLDVAKPRSAGQVAQHMKGATAPATSKHDAGLSSLPTRGRSAAVPSASLCLGCGKTVSVTGAVLTALSGTWHPNCWRCGSCQQLIEGSYMTDKAQNQPYHPQCYKEAFGKRCTVCKKTFDGTYTTVEGKPFHHDCFKCAACSKLIDGSYHSDDEHPGFYHPLCYKEAFGKRCTFCKKTFDSTYTTVKGKFFHHDCFRCAACSKPIDRSYQDDDQHPGFYHPHCHKEAFGKRCCVCNKTFEGEYSVLEGSCYHKDCFKCAACGKTVQGSHIKQDGNFYHPLCHREKFDPHCDVCTQLLPMENRTGVVCTVHCTPGQCLPSPVSYQLLYGLCKAYLPAQVNGRIEWSSSYFWKQKYCRSHSSDGTPHCCSCNKLKAAGTKWLTLSDKRMVCHDCSTTVVHDSAQAQPLLDEVLAFFAAQGMALRVRPPLLLVDGPTLEAEHGEDCDEDRGEDVAKGQTKSNGDETPVFHITGLCKSKSWGRVNHVVATHKGYSRLHKQPSLDATLRPADLSARNVEVTALLVMYGLPRLLTGSILAHECMHAWFVLNYIDCSNKTVNEGLSQLMALIWVEAQKSQGNWHDRLASYYGNQIRTHPSPIYGGGLQAALAVFQQYGLRKVLLHVKKFGVLPAEEVSTSTGDLQKRAIKDALSPKT